MRFSTALPLVALTMIAASPAAAQRAQTPDQRIDRLERQVRQVQRQVFPKGQPADTAGFSDEPAASQVVVTAQSNRLDALERQVAEIVRTSEENTNRLATMEAEVARLRADQDRRLRAIENAQPVVPDDNDRDEGREVTSLDEPSPPPSRPRFEGSNSSSATTTTSTAASSDPAEAAYDAGYQLWVAKKYDQAITALKTMAARYPNHRRVSWAHNLHGRALLDKGQPRAAAETLLANYRRDPKGERAQDSLFYLGKSLTRLGQPAQACKAYAELEDVYGTAVRPQIRTDLRAAKTEAKCS
ncbi:tetratricopeptide repeat protein [Sphingomonas sp. LY160]|uniref:tetratricopeptide repeat protein n=1 Tax=Sphingomonas sp. LY160 TaxID=3095342 RepID=UPI002ADEE6B0|nr:tetratricopeptide repeat protein [Sphingomonas sp. LY160]MEA1072077.1 tetratricopeptide repeat protein [Sphingomonas sp. LY160]